MIRSFSSVALTVLVAVALLWGNCAQCTMLISESAPSAGHDCCDQPSTDCHRHPAPKQDCGFRGADLAKALIQHEQQVAAPVLIANAARAIEPPAIITREDRSSALPGYSPPDLWVLNSTFLI